MQCCPKSIKTTLNRIFLVQCCLEPFGEYCTRFLPMQYFPKSIKTILSKMFSVQCCQKVLGKHCTSLLPVQCCPKRIKTTMNRIFSCAILSGASRAILSRVFPSAMLFQEYEDKIEHDFFLCNVVWKLLGNIAQGFYLCNVGPWLTDNFSE